MARRRNENTIPRRIQQLPRDLSGRPIPFFVRYVDDVPDCRFVDVHKLDHCILCRLCWVCGRPIAKKEPVGFTLSVENALQRSATEPPQHIDCAEYAARVWPMTLERVMPSDAPAYCLVVRPNPALICIWITRHWRRVDLPDGFYRFDLGVPSRTIWLSQGREVPRREACIRLNGCGRSVFILHGERDERAVERTAFIVKTLLTFNFDDICAKWTLVP